MSYDSTSRVGVNGVAQIFEKELKWIFREQPTSDWGVDAYVEIVDSTPTGQLLALQIKSGRSYFRKENKDGFIYRDKKRHLTYWSAYTLPVVLILYNPDTNQAFWQVVRPDLIHETAQAWMLVVPKHQSLDRSSMSALRALASTNVAIPSSQLTGPRTADSVLDNTTLVLQYLETQIGILSELPPYFEKDFSFDSVRQRVRVSRRRLTYRDFKTREAEAITRSGFFLKENMAGLGYFVRGADMYSASDSGSSSIFSWDDLRDDIHRGIILGDPGFGKTWLLKHEGVRLAKRGSDELRRGNNTPDKVLLPIFMRLGELAERLSDNDQEVSHIIAGIVAQISTLSSAWIIKQIEDGHAVLLLDALDEVDPNLRPNLQRALTRLSATVKSKILLSSRIVGYQRPFGLADTDSEREVEIVAFDTDQVKGFITAWFEEKPERGGELIYTLQTRASLGSLARIPILLSFICLLAKQKDEVPSQRIRLYETLLSQLLEGRWRESVLHEQNPDRIEAKLLLLEEIAWHFSGQTSDGSWHDLMPSDELGRVILESNQAAFLRSTAQHQFGILWELSERDGILVKAGISTGESARQVPYLFIHRTFHEYLLASYLAKLEVDQWQSEIRNHLWYDVDWEEPIILLAARLPDWEPLLELIGGEENEIFNRMLILAGRCLAEVGNTKNPEDAALIENALVTLLHSESESESTGARRALVMIRNPAVESLLAETFNKEPKLRSDIASDLIELNPAQALSVLKTSANSDDKWIRRAAITNLGKLDNDEARSLVSAALDDPEFEVRLAAAEAMGDLSDERIVTALREELIRSDGLGRSVLIRTISEMGGPEAIILLNELLESPDRFTHRFAIEGLGRMQNPKVKEILTVSLDSPRISVRIHAACELARSGSSEPLRVFETALGYDDLLLKMREFGAELSITVPERLRRVVKSFKNDSRLKEAYVAESSFYGGEYAYNFLLNSLSSDSEAIQWISAKILSEIVTGHFATSLRRALDQRSSEVTGKVAVILALLKYAMAISINSRDCRTFFIRFVKYKIRSLVLLAALDKDSMNQLEIERKLFEFGDALSVPEDTLRLLGTIKTTKAAELLTNALKNSVPDFRQKAIQALKLIDCNESTDGLRMALDDSDPYVRVEAAGALKQADEKTMSILKSAIDGADARLRRSAVMALENKRREEAEDLIRITLRDADSDVRWQAAESAKAIGIAGDKLAIAVFEEELLKPDSPFMGGLAAESLKEVGNQDALYSLMKGLHSHREAYFHAARVLGDIARGEFAVLVCDDVLKHWPSAFSLKRDYAYRLLSDLAPEVRAVVGDSWPEWRERIRKRIAPEPGFLETLAIGVLVPVAYVVSLPWRIGRTFRRRSDSPQSDQP